MIVTLDVYSGRENPSWELSEADSAKLIERVTRRAVKDVHAVDNVLGYRGFIVFAARDDEVPEGLPGSFRIGGQLPSGYVLPESIASPLSSPEEHEVARFLLHTGRETLEEGLGEFVEQQMRLQIPRKPTRITKDKALRALKARAPCIVRNTPYNPGFWNRPAVQPYNNCYNYAMNWRSDTFAQPGRISGHQYTLNYLRQRGRSRQLGRL
jgi:hypothetical protein